MNNLKCPPKRLMDQSGFTIGELLIVVSIVAVMAAVSLPMIQPAVERLRLSTALDTVSMQLRRARQSSVDHRRIYRVSVVDNAIRLDKRDPGWQEVVTINLPRGIEFAVPSPSPSKSPDNLGYSSSVNFSGSNTVFFHPDGSARDAVGQFVNGAVYVRRSEHPEHGAAVTLFGATGRIKPWRLEHDTSGAEWK